MNLFYYNSDPDFLNYDFLVPFSSTLQLTKEFTESEI